VDSGFYGLDKNLTYPQVLRMHETLHLFTRPEFQALQVEIFDERISYVINRSLGSTPLAFNLIGTGIVQLDRQDLFGNTYLLAMVLAHEGSHTMQDTSGSVLSCDEILRLEVGDQRIPPDFNGWDASQLVSAIKDGSMGAYHVSYWTLVHLGFNDPVFLAQIIRRGNINGEPLVLCTQ
jgi:hypothetical protein